MSQKPRDSFRVPNSIIQGLTTETKASLNRLSTFQIVTLLGLFAHVTPKQADREVRLRVSQILEVIEVSRCVTQVVNRTWKTSKGKTRRRRYRANRFSPKHMAKIHDALLSLFNQSVVIHGRRGEGQVERVVHILDCFG